MICIIDTDVLKVALQAPAKLQMAMPTEASYPIVWDSGASVSVSNDATDFQGTLTMANASPIQVKGVSQGVTVSGQGMVLWCLMDTTGMLRAIQVPALYIPEPNVRLLSTSSLLQVYKGEQIIQQPSGMTLSGIDGDPTRRPVKVHLNPKNNLPTSFGYDSDELKTATNVLSNHISMVHATQQTKI